LADHLDGRVIDVGKTLNFFVRAVRGGCVHE